MRFGKFIPELLFDSAERMRDRPALMVNRGDGTLDVKTYSQLREDVIRLSSFIQRTGFKAGDHIALLGNNSMEWATAYFAIQAAGCVVVPLDAAQKPIELRHIIHHSDSVAIFLAQKYNSVLSDESGDHFPQLPRFALEHINTLIKTEENPLSPRLPDDENFPAVIIYTSGTTGSPKGVVLTHRNIISDIAALVPMFPFTQADNFLSVLPVHHAFEATGGFLAPIAIGCGICYARALRAKEILEDISACDATIMLGVPLLFEKFYSGILRAVEKKGKVAKSVFGTAMRITGLLDSMFGGRAGKAINRKFRQKAGFKNMWLMISGGAAIRPEIVEFFNHLGITFVQGYGLTETSPVIAVNPPDRNKPSSVGPAIAGVELKIGNPDENGVGEILVRGNPVFLQYYKNEEATREAFTEDGWFRTGDLGKIDDDGYLYILGRAKNLIVTKGGKNVYPEEIEEKINESEFVLESMVIGVRRGGAEEPFAIIVPNYDVIDEKISAGISDEQLQNLFRQIVDDVNRRMASYKRIKGFRIQSEEFPKTSTKKIKRYMFTGDEINVN